MNSATLERLEEQIENMKIEPTRESILVIANVLVELLRETSRIDHIACSASDKATAAHELLNKLSS